ncbi:MAG TPA: class I SAM-dependent methyltransferase [Thermoleophilaceae bacterium]|jgi:SAM-dependent methyltransferase
MDDKEAQDYSRVRELIRRGIGGFSRYGDLDTLFDPRDRNVLDYGWAGAQKRYLSLIERGARQVAGIDLWWTQEDLDQVHKEVQDEGVADRVDFRLSDAYSTPFADDSFDIVVGGSILHHLDLERALPEIRRVLRPGGRAVFVEPLAHNPILRAGRVLTRKVRSEDGRPFSESDWERCANYFPDFEHVERELSTIPLMPLNLMLSPRRQEGLARKVWAFDERIMERYPRLRKHARITFLVLK